MTTKPTTKYQKARARSAWVRGIVDDLGGPERLSTIQKTLVDMAVRVKALLDDAEDAATVNRLTGRLSKLLQQAQPPKRRW
jgi:hypothetical protein